MSVNQQCLARERWNYFGNICPGVNKPVSLVTSSYVTEDRAEGWWQNCFTAPTATLVKETSATRQRRCPQQIVCCLHGLQLLNTETNHKAFSVSELREKTSLHEIKTTAKSEFYFPNQAKRLLGSQRKKNSINILSMFKKRKERWKK